jgi:tetratricopeptide (TPR) repeat protein
MWEATRAGETDGPRALLVTAPAGMGKTRLVHECARRLDARLLACGCSSYHQTTSLHPFRRLLQQICGVAADDDPAERVAKLRACLAHGEPVDDALHHDLPVLADVLGIPPDAISPPTDVDASKLRAIALAAAAQLIRSTTADGPLLLLVDDLHWADDSTLDLISFLLATPCPGMLLVLGARPSFAAPPWPEGVVRRLVLEPMAAADLGEMMHGMQQGSALQEAQRRQLVARSDGVPLFLEELVRSRSALGSGEAGAGSALRAPGSRIPAALRDPLLARLVLPGVDLPLAQIAATIGRDVDRELLRRASGLADRPFHAKLANLVAAGLVDPCDEATIRFRHELIREVAYETQRRSSCRERHSAIADLLAEGSVRRSGDAGELAFHLERAQRIGEAIDAYLDAARAHQALGAHKEAMSKLTHVLELVEQLPRGAPQLIGELTARQLRSFSAVLTGGYSAPETSQDHGRCVELCEHLGLAPELLPSLIVSWSYYCSHGDLAEAGHVCATMERVIGDTGASLPATELARGVVSFFLGQLDDAHDLMHAFVTDPWAHATDGPPAGWPLPNDPLAAVTAHLVFTTWMRGERAAADALGERALQRVAQLGFPFGPFTAGYVKSQLAIVRRLEGDHVAAGQLAEEMVELGDRHGFVLWMLAGQLQQLISQVHLGAAAALAPLEQAIGLWRQLLSIEVYTPYWLTELAAVQALCGRPDSARASLDEALTVAARTGSEFYSAETLRVRGLLRCAEGDRDGFDDIRAAIATARSQHAGAFELRAVEALELAAERPAAAS